MTGFTAFVKKEFTEQLRGYKALILTAVLFLFGMTSPLLAKMLPDILSGMTLEGMALTLPEPTLLDAYGQFFKNIGQLGFIFLLLLYGGLLSQDVSKGTLIVLLAKGLSRRAVIASKFVSALAVWTAGYILSAVAAYGYTAYLFGGAEAPHLLFALFCLWLFGAFVLALLLLSSAAARGGYGGLILTGGVLIVLLIVNILPAIAKWNPATLASGAFGLLTGGSVPDMTATVWTAAALTAACLIVASLIFDRKSL